MRKILLVVFAILLSCSSKSNKEQIPFTVSPIEDDEWVIYEGRIITDKGLEVEGELSLKQASTGLDSEFSLYKMLDAETAAYGSSTKGKYAVMYGLDDQAQGITLTENSKRKVNAPNNSIQEMIETPRLYFRTDSNEKLIQTDRNFGKKNDRYTLFKRSNLFTVEGYVTCADSTTDFFERNTRENWKVASIGAIDSVKINYSKLVTENFEGIYLKALAYSIADSNAQNKKALVVKRVLRMEKSPRGKTIE